MCRWKSGSLIRPAWQRPNFCSSARAGAAAPATSARAASSRRAGENALVWARMGWLCSMQSAAQSYRQTSRFGATIAMKFSPAFAAGRFAASVRACRALPAPALAGRIEAREPSKAAHERSEFPAAERGGPLGLQLPLCGPDRREHPPAAAGEIDEAAATRALAAALHVAELLQLADDVVHRLLGDVGALGEIDRPRAVGRRPEEAAEQRLVEIGEAALHQHVERPLARDRVGHAQQGADIRAVALERRRDWRDAGRSP